MDDDFDTEKALSKLFEMLYETNAALHNNKIDNNGIDLAVNSVKSLCKIFSFKLEFNKEISPYVESKIQERNMAKANKDYAASDSIRKELLQLGIILEDNKDGTTTWRKKL